MEGRKNRIHEKTTLQFYKLDYEVPCVLNA